MQWHTYLRVWVIAMIAAIFAIALMNLIVDPYGLVGMPEIPGLNVIKPGATTRTQVVKPSQGESARARTIILGNSRPEIGIDPESIVWPVRVRPIYNSAMPGASTFQAMRYGQNLITFKKPDLVIWGLDFEDFLIHPDSLPAQCAWSPTAPGWAQRLRVDTYGKQTKYWRWARSRDYANAILSTDAFVDSAWTLVSQRRDNSGTRTRLGFNPARDYLSIINTEGQSVLFTQKNAEIQERLNRTRWQLVSQDCDSSLDFRAVQEMLRLTGEMDVRIILFLNPYHADYLHAIWRAGLWPMFEEWKLRLTQIASTHALPQIVDFSVLSSYTTEVAPVSGKKNVILRWFWEPSHYRAELGDLMLEELLELDTSNREHVGVRLNLTRMPEHLNHQRDEAQMRWARNELQAVTPRRLGGGA